MSNLQSNVEKVIGETLKATAFSSGDVRVSLKNMGPMNDFEIASALVEAQKALEASGVNSKMSLSRKPDGWKKGDKTPWIPGPCIWVKGEKSVQADSRIDALETAATNTQQTLELLLQHFKISVPEATTPEATTSEPSFETEEPVEEVECPMT